MQLYEVHGAQRIQGQLVGVTHTFTADGPEDAEARYLALYPDQGAEVAFVVRLTTMHPKGLTMAGARQGFAELVRCPDCGQMELWTVEELQDHGQCRSVYDPCPACAGGAQ